MPLRRSSCKMMNYLRIETLPLAKSGPPNFRGIPGMPMAA